ncbi:hypothetical protein HIM_00778 [Hirsutella minnesotensis 3608]|nr:hypothetical protein HIM_00778 [Hirsutella minnesotensis 3608]
MDQQTSTSTVTVEYFDPHNVFKLIAPGLLPRLPLRNLHWQSHSGPLRSIETLHVELVPGGTNAEPPRQVRDSETSTRDDGFQTQAVGGNTGAPEAPPSQASAVGSHRRHQIPGLRRTPYLKVLLLRCDDNDAYKATVRSEVREWVKKHTPSSSSSKKSSNQEKHDAFEWLLVHVVIPNTAAASQPRSGKLSDNGTAEKTTSSRWRTGPVPLMEKLQSDFNSSSKGAPDRVAQIRVGINDVPYDILPRVVPAVPSGYSESKQDTEHAWGDLVAKFKGLILSSFDCRVSQYEEDIKEKDGQRSLPGWNFCTFFMLKEGLARGFESVGLVEDALVGYDELGVGLDIVIQEQAQAGSPERHAGAMLSYTDELKTKVKQILAAKLGEGDDEAEDLQSQGPAKESSTDDIVIGSTKKPYRDRILENKVSVFDFRCYIFSRQIALLLRLGNASSTREELLAMLKVQQDSVLRGVAPLAPPTRLDEEPENLPMLAEICRRTLEFIPFISQIMRQDILTALEADSGSDDSKDSLHIDSHCLDTVDNVVSSFAFSIAQQILAQTSTRALPIPSTHLVTGTGQEPKASIPEPKTMMHPARSSSLRAPISPRRPSSPGVFPGPGRRASVPDGEAQSSRFLKVGLEELAARRAELYMLSRSILGGLGKKRGWSDGWDKAPMIDEAATDDMEDVNLDDESASDKSKSDDRFSDAQEGIATTTGIGSQILRIAMDGDDEFYRLYEILTDKAIRHYTVASHEHAVQSCKADLAVLKAHLQDYRSAAEYFAQTTPFFGGDGWSTLELSMLAMYCRCLSELQAKDDLVHVALKLVTKACAAERAGLHKSTLHGTRPGKSILNKAALQSINDELFELLKTLTHEIKLPLANLLTNVRLEGPPNYHHRRDTCSLSIKVYSLLPEDVTIDSARLKAASIDGGPCKELVFKSKEPFILSPGTNTFTLDCNSVGAGRFGISHLGLSSSKLLLYHDRDPEQTGSAADIFRNSQFRIFQRTGSLDVRVLASKHTCLDKNNSLDLELAAGWNDIKSCEVRVRAATGGLRLLTTDAKVLGSDMEFAKPPEPGAFFLGGFVQGTSVTLRFPYSVEQDVADLQVKVDVKYVTEADESFSLAKSLVIPVALALGVNVQDVFKHDALFSRFHVSTVTASPLFLHKSELLESELFESAFGVPPANTVTIFPRQSANLLYRIKRKAGIKAANRAGKTMYLKLYYSVLQSDAEDEVKNAVTEELRQTSLEGYTGLAVEQALMELRRGLEGHDLERAALLGEMSTAVMDGVAWEARFEGIGSVPGTDEDAAMRLGEALRSWIKKHPRIKLSRDAPTEPSSIMIPVDIPSLSVVHTADLRLHTPEPSGSTRTGGGGDEGAATVCVNQMIPATLHLRWTRIWDTETAQREAQEFVYEVTAPADTWILGGRRKGRFVIPGSSPDTAASSSAETEAAIPLIVIPQREGWLPLPVVEIREVIEEQAQPQTQSRTQSQPQSQSQPQQQQQQSGEGTRPSEVDWRNLGEVVRVVKERRGVTVSLDASGPAGGPLVLASEAWPGREARIVA